MRDLEELVGVLCEEAPARRPLIILGAGASADAPSYIPTADRVVEFVLDALSIEGEARTNGNWIEGLLPEAMYSAILPFLGDTVHSLWEALEDWRDLGEKGIGPNRLHAMAVRSASWTRLPVITVNFDTMLEEAARRLRLTPRVSLPSASGLRHVAIGGPDEVEIWKIHGSAENASSVRSTLERVTTRNEALHRLIDSILDNDPCVVPVIIGYSGRDLDFFPHLLGALRRRRPTWVDLGFPPEHRAWRLGEQGASMVRAPRRWIERLPDVPGIEFAARSVRLEELVQSTVAGGVRRRLALDQQTGASTHLARGAVLFDVGANLLAAEEVRTGLRMAHLAAEHRVLALILKANIAHEASRYEDMYRVARLAAMLARRTGNAELREVALQTCAFAMMQRWIPALGYRDIRRGCSPAGLAVASRMLWRAIVGGVRTKRWHRRRETNQRVLTESYLEHLVRLYAAMDAVLGAVPPARGFMVRLWKRLRHSSELSGYAYGVANVDKYLARHDVHLPESLGGATAQERFELLDHKTGRALNLRDQADQLVRDPQRVAESEARAVELYLESSELAASIGDVSLQLKNAIRIRQVSPDHSFNQTEVQEWFDGIQGRAYRKAAPRLIEWLLR